MDERPCEVDGCHRTRWTGRYCSTHHRRLHDYGSFDPPPRESPTERFRRQHATGEGCWDWTGARDRDGYGVIRWSGKQCRANRVAYELAFGPVPDGMWVLHSCDNPPCVRPDHLALGAPRANVLDAVDKGRRLRGSRMPAAKLTEGQVRAIRTRYAEGGIRHVDLAEGYHVSRALISNVLNRKAWKHI